MNKIGINKSLSESKQIVVKAFQQTEGINKYEESDYQIVGKTGISFPRILWSYGESVYVDFSDTDDPKRTEIEIRAEKEVSMNVGGNAQKFKRRFINELNKIQDTDSDNISVKEDYRQSKSEEQLISNATSTFKKNTVNSAGNKNSELVKTDHDSLSDGQIILLLFISISFLIPIFIFILII